MGRQSVQRQPQHSQASGCLSAAALQASRGAAPLGAASARLLPSFSPPLPPSPPSAPTPTTRLRRVCLQHHRGHKGVAVVAVHEAAHGEVAVLPALYRVHHREGHGLCRGRRGGSTAVSSSAGRGLASGGLGAGAGRGLHTPWLVKQGGAAGARPPARHTSQTLTTSQGPPPLPTLPPLPEQQHHLHH